MRLILQILVLSSNIKKGEIERTLSVNLVLTFDHNTWKYLTYSLVSTGNMTVYIKRILVYVYICKKEEMSYCRKWNRKKRRHCRLAGPLAGLGRAPGRACLVGDRPPGRPRPPEIWFWKGCQVPS